MGGLVVCRYVEFHSKNKSEKLLYLVGFIIGGLVGVWVGR